MKNFSFSTNFITFVGHKYMYKFLAFYGQLHFFTFNVHFHQRRLTLTSLQFTLHLLHKLEEKMKSKLNRG